MGSLTRLHSVTCHCAAKIWWKQIKKNGKEWNYVSMILHSDDSENKFPEASDQDYQSNKWGSVLNVSKTRTVVISIWVKILKGNMYGNEEKHH